MIKGSLRERFRVFRVWGSGLRRFLDSFCIGFLQILAAVLSDIDPKHLTVQSPVLKQVPNLRRLMV